MCLDFKTEPNREHIPSSPPEGVRVQVFPPTCCNVFLLFEWSHCPEYVCVPTDICINTEEKRQHYPYWKDSESLPDWYFVDFVLLFSCNCTGLLNLKVHCEINSNFFTKCLTNQSWVFQGHCWVLSLSKKSDRNNLKKKKKKHYQLSCFSFWTHFF